MTYIPKGAVKVSSDTGYVPNGAVLVNHPADYATKEQPKSKNIVETISEFLTPRAESTSNAAVGGYVLGNNVTDANKRIQELSQQSRDLISRAKSEPDQKKKNLLLQQSRDIDAQIDALGQNITRETNNVIDKGQITDQDLQSSNLGFAARRGIAVAGELGSYLIPAGEVSKGAGILEKVGKSALTGAEVGGLLGATDPNAKNFKDRVTNTAKGAATGAVLSGGMTAAGEAGSKILSYGKDKLLGTSSQAIRRVLKPSITDAAEFKRNFGSKIEDEISKRDAKNIKGMGFDELYSYFDDKYKDAFSKKATKLAESGETVEKQVWKNQISKLQQEITPENGYVNSEPIQSSLSKIQETLDKSPDKIPAKTAGNIIRSMQDDASYGIGSTSKAGENALKGVIKNFNDELKKKVGGLDDINKSIQLYRIAKDSVSKSAERDANKVSQTLMDKLLQAFPTIAGGSIGIATKNPMAGVAAYLAMASPGIIREGLRTPEAQTRVAAGLREKIPGITNDEVQQVFNFLNRAYLQHASQQKGT